MTLNQCLVIAGFLAAAIAVALRFAVLLIEDSAERTIVTNLAVAMAALATVLFAMGTVSTC